MATETTGRLFPLGQVVATPGALEALKEAGVAVGTLVARHAVGDWGHLDPEDKGLNEQALVSGARILGGDNGSYILGPYDINVLPRVAHTRKLWPECSFRDETGLLADLLRLSRAESHAADSEMKRKNSSRKGSGAS